jgi:environmental stress-induced protein Ves
MKIFSQNEFKNMPWKNGNGVTTEIFRYPNDGEFKLRLSVATVSSDGFFSIFPQIDRKLLILNGEGVELNFQGKKVILTPNSAPLSFQGEEIVECKLMNGPVTDFNLMLKRNWGLASMRWITNPKGIVSDDLLFLYRQEMLIELGHGESYIRDGRYLEIKIKRIQMDSDFI